MKLPKGWRIEEQEDGWTLYNEHGEVSARGEGRPVQRLINLVWKAERVRKQFGDKGNILGVGKESVIID